MHKVKLKDELDAAMWLPMERGKWYDVELMLDNENMFHWVRIKELQLVVDARHLDFKKE